MRWGAEQIAGWARAAGWRNTELETAVAVALAASDGFDVPGLWSPWEAIGDGPAQAGHVFATWVENGRSWAGHPAFESGAWLVMVPEARRGAAAAGTPLEPDPSLVVARSARTARGVAEVATQASYRLGSLRDL